MSEAGDLLNLTQEPATAREEVMAARIAELEADKRTLVHEAAKLLEEGDARIAALQAERDAARESHEGQVRNTLAFQAELETAKARIAELEAEIASLKAMPETDAQWEQAVKDWEDEFPNVSADTVGDLRRRVKEKRDG